VQKGAAMACSSDTTVIWSRGFTAAVFMVFNAR
jgi:hypothetical protein